MRGTRWHLGVLEDEALARLDASGVVDLDGRERLDVEVGAGWARVDELSRNGEDTARSKRSVEGVGDRHVLGGDTEESLVPGLNGGDGSSSAKNHRGVDQRSSTEIGGKTDGLKCVGSGDHTLSVGEAKLVRALLNRGSTRSLDGSGESSDVSRLC